jgi:antitoxin ParD1/3/4
MQKLSISIPQQQYDFIEKYQNDHHFRNRSEVIKRALHLLQQIELETYYRAANAELNTVFDTTIGDGLEDEAW